MLKRRYYYNALIREENGDHTYVSNYFDIDSNQIAVINDILLENLYKNNRNCEILLINQLSYLGDFS